MTEAYMQYSGRLRKYACFKLSNNVLGRELVQDTFLKTWNYLIKGGQIDKMQAFLYRVLNDLIIDEYRKRKTVSLDVLSEQGFEPGVNEVPRLINKLDGKKALHLVKRLPEKYRRVLVMRYVQDLSLKEMSLINGQSENTNAVQIKRGLRMIKELSKKNKRRKNK